MRKLITLVFALFVLIGCATTYYDSEGKVIPKDVHDKLTAEAVKGHLDSRRYRIFVDRVYPAHGPAIYLNDDWGIEVSGDSVGMFLPYFGRAYFAPYGHGIGLSLLAPLDSYQEEAIKDGSRVTMTTRKAGEYFQIILEQYNNATAQLTVYPSNREIIRFNGVMFLNDKFTPLDSLNIK